MSDPQKDSMGEKPGAELQDNEAAGLLMLFSNQPQPYPQQINSSDSNPSTTTKAEEQPSSSDVKPSIGLAKQQDPNTQKPQQRLSTEKQITPVSSNATLAITTNSTRFSPPLRTKDNHVTTSPGPAAAALASGNGSNKAMVAAAALAAAAATPLPFLSQAEQHMIHKYQELPKKGKLSPPLTTNKEERLGIVPVSKAAPASIKIYQDPVPTPIKIYQDPVPAHVSVKKEDKVESSVNSEPKQQLQPPQLTQEEEIDNIIDSEMKGEETENNLTEPETEDNRSESINPQTNAEDVNQDTEVETETETKIKIKDKDGDLIMKGSTIPTGQQDKESKASLGSISPPSYAVDPDEGTIGCICGYDHDDGFTIQCDRCFRWQHAVCMSIQDIDDVPENYLCSLCDPTLAVDAKRAHQLQEARLQPKRKKSNNHHDMTSSTNNNNNNNNNSNNNSNSGSNSVTAGSPVQPNNKKEHNIAGSPRSNSATNNSNGGNKSTSPTANTPSSSKQKKRKTDPVDPEDESNENIERYQTLYFEISESELKSSSVKSLIKKLPKLMKEKEQDTDTNLVKFSTMNEYNKQLLPKNSLQVKSAPENPKTKFTGLSKLGLYTSKTIKQNQLIKEIVGELDLKQNYMEEQWNQYWLFGCPKPKVSFHPFLPVAIDQRGMGNLTRFVRKSCKPNCEIKTVLISEPNKYPVLKFVLSSIKEIKADQELSLPWEWDATHPIKLIESGSTSFEDLSTDLKIKLINSIHSILDLTDCGCVTNSSDCLIGKIKKITSYLQRNTRKQNLFYLTPTPGQTYDEIEIRLKQRDELIRKAIAEQEEQQLKERSSGLLVLGSTDEDEDEDLVDSDGKANTSNTTANQDNNNETMNETYDDDDITNDNNDDEEQKFRQFKLKSIWDSSVIPPKFQIIKKFITGSKSRELNDEGDNYHIGPTLISKDDELSESYFIPIQLVPGKSSTDSFATISNASQPGTDSFTTSVKNEPKSEDFTHRHEMHADGGGTTNFGSGVLSSSGSAVGLDELNGADKREEKPKVVKKFSLADYKKKSKIKN